MPTSFGQFCSRDCQMLAYNSHTQAHRLMVALNTKAQGVGRLVESVAVALKDAANRRLLPSLRNGTVLSILLVGCRDFVEGNVDFFRLYERLIGLELYALECSFTLEVTLVGPELTSRAPFHHPSGRVTVVRLCGRLQRMFPPDATYNPLAECYVNVGSFSHTVHKVNVSQYMSFNTYDGSPAYAPTSVLSTHYHCAFLRNPGLGLSTTGNNSSISSPGTTASTRSPPNSKHKLVEPTLPEQWAPAVTLLQDAGLLTFVLNCCHVGAKSQPQKGASDLVLPAIHSSPTAGKHPSSDGAGSTSSVIARPAAPSPSGSPAHPADSSYTSPNSAFRKLGAPVYTPVAAPEYTDSGSGGRGPQRNATNAAVVLDEHVLDTVYQASIMVPHTCLPCSACHSAVSSGEVVTSSSGHSAKKMVSTECRESYYPSSCMYLAFRGRRGSAASAQIEFFQYMAQHNAALREAALQLASDLGTGRIHLAGDLTQTELEQEAIRRNMLLHPLQHQLLQHELLTQMRQQSSPGVAQATAVTGTGAYPHPHISVAATALSGTPTSPGALAGVSSGFPSSPTQSGAKTALSPGGHASGSPPAGTAHPASTPGGAGGVARKVHFADYTGTQHSVDECATAAGPAKAAGENCEGVVIHIPETASAQGHLPVMVFKRK
jgi:ferredoxin